MAWYDFLSGTPSRSEQFQRFTGPQQGALDQILSQGLSGLQGMQGKFDFAPIEQQARSNFNTQTIPSIAERFTSLGSGSQNSSAFQNALGSAGSGLEQSLAALKSQYGLQQQGMNQNLIQNLLGFGLQPRYENAYFPRQPGFAENAGSSLFQGFGTALPFLFGGIPGGSSGGLLGLLSQLLGSNSNSSSQGVK